MDSNSSEAGGTTLKSRAKPVPHGENPKQPPNKASISSQGEATDANLKDAGNRPDDHYKSGLSPWRYSLRNMCLPIVRKETTMLAKAQNSIRHPLLDVYFAWTANLASHTFYVLMLPPSFWFGASSMGRDLVFVLGMGIYITGFCKDLLCLPRPRSPPLHRITMSTYTTQEYGWPSSHSANATSVTLVLLFKLLNSDYAAGAVYYMLLGFLFLYYSSLILGRIYCGMHGIFDIMTGIAIGVGVFLYRYFWGEAHDQWLFFSSRNSSWYGIAATFAVIVFVHLFLIHVYPEPVDDCPCFDDSVAFVGVLIGLDLSHYLCVLTGYFTDKNVHGDPMLIPFAADCGPVVMSARFGLGVGLVLVWKTLSKPVVFTILPPLYKAIGVNLPRSHFISTAHTQTSNRYVRRQSLSNMQHEPLDMDIVRQPVTVTMSPVSDADAYELLNYQSQNSDGTPIKLSGVFKPRYDVEIIGRCIIYAGISAIAVWGLGLSVVKLDLI